MPTKLWEPIEFTLHISEWFTEKISSSNSVVEACLKFQQLPSYAGGECFIKTQYKACALWKTGLVLMVDMRTKGDGQPKKIFSIKFLLGF